MEDDPRPFGYWTRRSIALDPRCPYKDSESLAASLNNPLNGMPVLKPILRAGGMYLYAEADVARWFREHEQWRADEPKRRAARRAAEDARQAAQTAEEMARIKLQQETLQTYQTAHAEHEADREKWKRGVL